MAATGLFVHLPAVGQDVFFPAIMAIIRGHKADRTVQMAGIIPVDKFIHPGLGVLKAS